MRPLASLGNCLMFQNAALLSKTMSIKGSISPIKYCAQQYSTTCTLLHSEFQFGRWYAWLHGPAPHVQQCVDICDNAPCPCAMLPGVKTSLCMSSGRPAGLHVPASVLGTC